MAVFFIDVNVSHLVIARQRGGRHDDEKTDNGDDADGADRRTRRLREVLAAVVESECQ